MRPSPAMHRYIVHWGEMGQRWNVNRTVAQIHALLYLAEGPMAADEIVETLSVARSNVSTSIKELLAWDLVRLVHIPGDRRDHFEARQDPWDMLMTIVEGRKRREIDPTLAILRDCVAAAEADGETPPQALAKLQRMLDLTQKLSTWYEQIRGVPRPVLVKLLGLGAKITTLVGR